MVIDMETLSLPTESRFYGNPGKRTGQAAGAATHRTVLGHADGRQVRRLFPDQFGRCADRCDGEYRQRNGGPDQPLQPVPSRPTRRSQPSVRIRQDRADLGLDRRPADPAGRSGYRLRRHPQAVRTLADRAARHGHRDRSGGGSGKLPAGPLQHPDGGATTRSRS